jgi:hypothetical protein
MPIRGKIEKQCPLSVQIFGCVVLIQGQAMTTIFSKKNRSTRIRERFF